MNLKKVIDDEEEEEETSLFAGIFKGTCHGCGKQGHKRPDCPEHLKYQKFRGRRDFKKRTIKKCAHCGKMHNGKCLFKYGHPETRNENANFSTDDKAEVVLTAVDFKQEDHNYEKSMFAGHMNNKITPTRAKINEADNDADDKNKNSTVETNW